MATGILMNYGTSMVTGALGNMAMGYGARAISGQDTNAGDMGMDMGGGALGMGSFMGGGDLFSGSGMVSSFGNMAGMMGGGTGGSTGSATGSSGSLLTGGTGGASSMGMFSQFGQSIFNNSSEIGDAQYNSKMTELRNYNTMQYGVYNRDVSYKEAELVNKEAEVRLAALRREMYRREHSVGSHKGVRLDSGSVVDVKEDLIKQANYDAEIVKYQAEVDTGRYMDQGNMSVWTAESTSVMNKNVSDNANEKVLGSAGDSIMSSGMNAFGSLLGS
ncbi:hypothetical protein [Maridesulfovibrio zosterae]|uniref:hypothetical protein n=1 Tax=Maridesulfovibrio zosterae TaxID=82171 RepID=UPI000420A964|nr:hypothetical protein [Maridesulfovibrio zosterae]